MNPTKKTSSNRIEDYITARGITAAAFAKEVGVSPSTVSHWIRSGECPAFMEKVIDGLEARNGKLPKSKEKTYVISGRGDKVDTILACAVALGLNTLKIGE